MRKSPFGLGRVDALGHCSHDLQLDVPGRLDRPGGSAFLAGDLPPAHAEVLCDVGDGRARDACARVVPADLAARGMAAAVEAIAGFRGQVDSAHESDPVVDHDRLLVVAVHRPLLRIERAADLACRRRGARASVAPSRVRVETTAAALPPRRARAPRPVRRARPGDSAESPALPARQREIGREEPAGDVDVRLGPLELRHHPRQRFGTVDQDLKRTSRPRLRLSRGPAARRSIKRPKPADPLQPPPMMRTCGLADRRSQPAVSAERERP